MGPCGGKTFDDITERLDEIVSQVRSKDTSLERSLDLFDEAIKLGSEAVDMVDRFELSPREAELLDGPAASDVPAGEQDAPAAGEAAPAAGA
ncbi:MAG: exodeoxyribonuclease VII small subunit [Coriobacteriaceae bacterium]|nr:exodeoxyribonuclease VII small subunit [Coriobacteriaceae bacterium]